MPYNAKIYNVMIASPGDVQVERQAAREIIHEWNAIHSLSRSIALLPLGWDTHSHPSMEDRAQEVINSQVLEDADLLVAMFWTRIGTPTGKAASGTVEEIEKHIAAGKPAMIYFSNAPVRPDSVDEEQYRTLKDFKADLAKRGLIDTYDTPVEFGTKFRRHLASKVYQDAFFETASPEGAAADDETWADALVVGTRDKASKMSQEAKLLLIEAAQDQNGTIIYSRHMAGESLSTHGREFIEDGASARERALWRNVMQELEIAGFIRPIGHKGQIFEVTHAGHEAADFIVGS